LISEVILKVAGMEAEESKPYYPRPSIAGPERCLRQMVYWASNTPRDKRISDRAIVVMNDSSFHETLTEDWLNKTAFRLHSQQMEVEIAELDFYNPPFILKGHIDGIITDMLGFEALNVDIPIETKDDVVNEVVDVEESGLDRLAKLREKYKK